MEEYESEISTHLDQLGLSLEQVEWRRRFWRHRDVIWNLQYTLLNKHSLTANTQGSMAEGVGLVAMGSDVDTMACYHDARIIHDTSDWEFKPDINTFLADPSDVHAGYCILKRMYREKPTLTGTVYNTRSNIDFYTTTGPAQTDSTGGVDMDIVPSFQTSWPTVANGWIRRNRSNNFPPAEFISSAVKKPIHVVHTGYKYSSSRDIEWRFSFSRLECDIIQLWPIKTLQCYVLLKHLKKEFNKLLEKGFIKQFPSVPHALCSYHMKTLLFRLVEEIGVQYWRDNSLLACLTLCLIRLRQYVEHRWLPHYFISENNLFDTWDTGEVHCLARFIHVLASDKHRLYEECCSIIGNLSKGGAVREREFVKKYFIGNVYVMINSVVEEVSSNDIGTKFAQYQSFIDKLASSTAQCDPELSPVLLYMADVFKIRYCTCILSTIRETRMSNATCFLLSRIAEQILRLSVHGGKYVLVQMANFWYQTGRYRRAALILEKALDVQPLRHDQDSMHAVLDKLQTYPRHKFLKSEIHATPYALQLAMYKTNKVPRNVREHVKSNNAPNAMVNVDSLIYYLQYLCYVEMGKDRKAQVAVDNLECVSKNDKDWQTKDTNLNLLGDCYVRRGDLCRATSCFVQSVRIEPKYTSSLIHLAITIGKATRRQ